jgi:hypothetical protein
MRLRTFKAATTITNEAIAKTIMKYEIKVHLLIPIERIATVAPGQHTCPVTSAAALIYE